METRQTVDFGIDLGTTNSAVACTERGTAVMVKSRGSDITPSVVARKKSGVVRTGQAALNDPSLLYARQFKRLMGTNAEIGLADGNDYTPEELSAEVLKELKAQVKEQYDIDLEHAVITVPAMFQQPQCEATHRAAQMAGLQAVTLLQEPIAAATAYLGESETEGDYLVYDLGGGTFDVSIVRLRDGEMSVIAHGGDNFLGGADFDKRIANWVKKQVSSRGNVSELDELPGSAILLRECEEAKKRLSTQTQASIDLSDLELPVSKIDFSQELLLDLIGDQLNRTVDVARERITQAGLNAQRLKGILLVGGPTKAAYLRTLLKDAFAGVPLVFDEDPMTVVARGAALHASTLKKPTGALPKVSGPDAAVIDLFFDPVSSDAERTVSGKVVQPAGFVGEVRLERASGDWNSGWITLRNGAFQSEVVLSDKQQITDFTILLRDAKGTLQSAQPSTITLRMGNMTAAPVAPYNYGVALEDKTMATIIRQNQTLPYAETLRLSLTKAIPAGSSEEVVFHVLEGLSRVAEDNVEVGRLRVQGIDLERPLPKDEPIEVRIHINESRLISARVSVPRFDLDWRVKMQSLMVSPPIEDLQKSVWQTEAAMESLAAVIAPEDELVFRETQRRMEQIEADLQTVQNSSGDDLEAAPRLASNLADTRVKLREQQERYETQIAYEKAIKAIDDAERIANDFENRLDAASANDLRQEAERQKRLNSPKDLAVIEERADVIFYRYYRQTREFWINHLEWLEKQARFVDDTKAFYDCISRAAARLDDDDEYEGTRLNIVEAHKHLPDDESQENRFAKAFLRQ